MYAPSLNSNKLFHAMVVAGIAALMGGTMTQAYSASGSVKCKDGKTYTASVPGGSCKTGANWVTCTGSGGSKSDVSCNRMPGPCESSGSGSCKSELKVKDIGGTTLQDKLKIPRGITTEQPMMKSN